MNDAERSTSHGAKGKSVVKGKSIADGHALEAAAGSQPLQNVLHNADAEADGAGWGGAGPDARQAGPSPAGMIFAAADGLLGHLLRYDAMLEWDRCNSLMAYSLSP